MNHFEIIFKKENEKVIISLESNTILLIFIRQFVFFGMDFPDDQRPVVKDANKFHPK